MAFCLSVATAITAGLLSMASAAPVVSAASVTTTAPAHLGSQHRTVGCLASSFGTPSWTTYGGGPAHASHDIGQRPAANVLHVKWRTPALDGAVYAEPVLAGGCLIIATEDNSLYAFDAVSGALRWHDQLAPPVPGSALPCGDISPSGITGTPVVDAARGELWVVELTERKAGPEHLLVGVDVGDGHVLSTRQLLTPRSSPAAMQQRGALVLSHGNVYIPFGGLYGDCANYHGTVVSMPELPGRSPAYFVVPTARQAGIWAPGGPDLLGNGDLLLADGNGAAGPGQRWDGSDAVFRLSSNLRVLGSFAPTDWAQLNVSDLDLGSTSPALLPNGLALQVGKDGLGYLLDVDRLGGVGGQVSTGTVCPSGGAFGNDAVDGSTVYVPCRAGLTAVHVQGHTFKVTWTSTGSAPGSPVVAGGKVWLVTSTGQLQGLQPSTGRVVGQLNLANPLTHFPWLVAVGATLYAPDANSVMALAGL